MKSLIFPAIIFFFSIICNAQSTPEAFLGMLPKVPSIDCNRENSMQAEARIIFQDQIASVRDLLSDAIKNEKQKNKNAKMSVNMKNQAIANSGLSEKELNSLSDKNTDKNEKDRLIDKSVKSQTGFSMEEMQKLKNMSKEERKKWAMGNYDKVIQNEKSKSEENKSLEQPNFSMADLASEQQKLAENLQRHFSRLEKIKADVETAAVQQKIILDNKLKEIAKKYESVNDGENATKDDLEKLRQARILIREAKVEYCSKLTPLQIDYLINYESSLKSNILPDIKRTEEIEFQMSKITMANAEESCFQRLRAIENYSAALNKAFDFYLDVDKSE